MALPVVVAAASRAPPMTGIMGYVRFATIVTVWIFVMWLGEHAINTADRELLFYFVLFTAFGLAGLLAWRWKEPVERE